MKVLSEQMERCTAERASDSLCALLLGFPFGVAQSEGLVVESTCHGIRRRTRT